MTGRFLQEARAQARLTSPHICKIHEAGFVDGKPYIAMELIDGASLDRAGQALSLIEKVQVMRDVAQAMHLAHEEGIIHRDLKPSNIMLERLGGGRLRPVVMDFGLARDRDASVSHGLTESGAVIGTPAYMSPEQARGEARRLDRRSDVYSLGATLYDLLSGKPPFQDETVVNLLLKVVNEPPTPLRSRLPDVPDALDLIVSKCLNKEPEQRYASARALAEDLDRYLSAGRVVARRLGYGYRLRYFARRNRAMTVLAGALISAAIALLVVGIRGRLLSLRQAREAREQAALAQTLGQSVKDLEWLVRTAYLLPLHDSSYEKGIVRARMARITADLATAGEHGVRLGAYVLGRGHLALHEWDLAHTQLKRAQDLGYRDVGLDYALGRVLGEKYSRALDEARKSGDKSFVEKRKKELETEFLIPARQHLQRSRGQSTEAPSYVEALIDFYNEHYDAALLNAHMARKQAPWLYEAAKLEGDVHMVRALAFRDRGDNDNADKSFALAVSRYEEAAGIGHSDHEVHEALAEAWIRQEEMDLYRGVDPTPKMARALAAADHAIEAAPKESYGHTKKAFAYFFTAQHHYKVGSKEESIKNHKLQISESNIATQIHPSDHIAHDIKGNGLQSIIRINEPQYTNIDESLKETFTEYESALNEQPFFPWALADYAGALYIKANYLQTRNIDPTPVFEQINKLTAKALNIDPQFMNAYAIKLIALSQIAKWETEHGQSPVPVVEKSRLIAEIALKNNPNYWPLRFNLLFSLLTLSQYKLDTKTSNENEISEIRTQITAIREIDNSIPDTEAVDALASIMEIYEDINNGRNPNSAILHGKSAISRCLSISKSNKDCLSIAIHLQYLELVVYPTKNQSSEKSLIPFITGISETINHKDADHYFLTLCAESCANISTAWDLSNSTLSALLSMGLSCANRGLELMPGSPRVLAWKSKLLWRRSLTESGKTRAATQHAAQELLASALSSNATLRKDFGEVETKLSQSLQTAQK